MISPARVLLSGLLALLIAPTAFAQDADAEIIQTGDVLLLQGQVLDTNGSPIPGSVVEIWQTDVNGNYNHPNDADPADLLPTFQYMGTAATDAEGYYAFRTIKPAAYEPRPPHIHVKVKLDGQTLLTTQFYFAVDHATVESDGVFRAGGDGDSLFLTTHLSADPDGSPIYLATGNLVIALAAGGVLTPTPRQAEGPYYPVVDFSGYDNDLTSTAADDAPVMPLLGDAIATPEA